jgi:hypothetical protein
VELNFGLFVASLINAPIVWSVSFGGRPSLGKFVEVPYSFNVFYNGFNGALWDVQSFIYIYIYKGDEYVCKAL